MSDQKILGAFVEQEQTIFKLKQRIRELEELLSEDLVAENAKLRARVDEFEENNREAIRKLDIAIFEQNQNRLDYLSLFGQLQEHLESIPKIKADAVREAANSVFVIMNLDPKVYEYFIGYADKLEEGK